MLGAQLISMFVTTGYPALKTVEALQKEKPARENDEPSEQRKWLIYWGIYGIFLIVETILLSMIRVNFIYWVLKSIIFIFLYSPEKEGALHLYSSLIGPFLEAQGDALLSIGEDLMDAITSTKDSVMGGGPTKRKY